MVAHTNTTLQVKMRDKLERQSGFLLTDLSVNRLTFQHSSNLARSLRAAGQKRDKPNKQI